MSNSPLVSYTKISPNRGNTLCGIWKPERTGKIDTITIHCVVGQLSVETIGAVFAPKNVQASSNYGIGFDGRIGMYVEEKDRSWCSSNADNDNRAITIECASDKTHPYAINDKVYDSLIELCADICKRNNIKKLLWKGDKSLIGQVNKQNMTVHRWFANKACPGDYIYSRLGQIANEVNLKLSSANKPVQTSNEKYYIQTGAFRNKEYADGMYSKLTAKGFKPTIMYGSSLYKVVFGPYTNSDSTKTMVNKLSKAGFGSCLTTKVGKAVSASNLKSIDAIAKEVIRGKWGIGNDRKKRLEKAGYDYEAVQAKVNELM